MSSHVIAAIIIIIIAIISVTFQFLHLTKEKKIANIKEWLKYAVTLAEKDLGSGTGQLKLRQVYNMAISQFPWIVQLVEFEQFSKWVDEALDWMKKQIDENKAVDNFIRS